MLVPKHLQKFLSVNTNKKRSNITSGTLTCCNTNKFKVYISGLLKSGRWGKPYFQQDENGLVMLCKCAICGREVLAFDSKIHGYDACIETENVESAVHNYHAFSCSKCHHDTFYIEMAFEYSPEEDENSDVELSNAFSWVWGSMTCVSCGKQFKRILDYETG